MPAAHEEETAGPQNHRRGQDKFDPFGNALRNDSLNIDSHPAAHRDDQHRDRQDQANPELAGERPSFDVLLRSSAKRSGFEPHSALRATARMVLLDLRVHWTSVNGLGWDREGRQWFKHHAAFRAIA